MSNILELTPMVGGQTNTAQKVFAASTNDALATVTTAGYLTDKVTAGVFSLNDVIFLAYDVDGTPGNTVGYVSTSSAGVYGFTVGIQGVAATSLRLAKKVVANYAIAGGAAAQTITDAAILTTDVILVSVNSVTTAGAYMRLSITNAGTATVTFNADPGASVVDYVLYATV